MSKSTDKAGQHQRGPKAGAPQNSYSPFQNRLYYHQYQSSVPSQQQASSMPEDYSNGYVGTSPRQQSEYTNPNRNYMLEP